MASARVVRIPPVTPPPPLVVLDLTLDEAHFLRGLVGSTSIAKRSSLIDSDSYPEAIAANLSGVGSFIYGALNHALEEDSL